WSVRHATQAAQKLPTDWEDQCKRAHLRIAYSIKEHNIPSALYVNSDQTQVVYAQGASMTWAETGARQVSTVGEEEKRAFTCTVSVANDGTLLPFQAIYKGLTKVSQPAEKAPYREECISAGMLIEHSGTDTYWANQETMRHLVDQVIQPYFDRRIEELGLPATQKCIWQIDAWSVHRSEEFRTWMKKEHKNIILMFVPGGCT
ncbi:hypothetical protein PENSPDRAFT_547351, partial [Peniophora sp. CONT]